jgi:chemotaxis protein MotB
MKNIVGLSLILISLAGCVTSGKYQEQVAKTENATKLAQQTQAQLDDAKKVSDKQKADLDAANAAIEASKKTETDLHAKIKADDDQITAIQKSNEDLTQSLEAKRGELAKKLSELIKERDLLTQQLAEVTRSKAGLSAQVADLTTKLDATTAEKAALQKAKDDEVARVKKSYEDLTAGLKSEIQNGKIQITQLKGKLTLNLVDKILFDSGAAEVKDDGKAVLDRVAEALKTIPDKDIHIEGHTDNIPIRGELAKKFPSNWELSAARATSVARYLQDHGGVDPKRLVVTGYADERPVAPNDTTESRALNRRIEIVLAPHD